MIDYDKIKELLADTIETGLAVQSYHWNLEGIGFISYHNMFGDIYSDLSTQTDMLAEYIRVLSDGTEYVNASVEIIRLNKTVKTKIIVGNKLSEMCSEIILLLEILIATFTELSKSNDVGFANYCSDRVSALSKFKWMLVASTK